nr:ribosomal protein S19 [Coptis chinensis]
MVDHKVEKWLELNAEKLLFVVSEGKVGHKFGEFASTRKRRPSRKNIGPGKKRGGKTKESLSAYGTKRKSDIGKT